MFTGQFKVVMTAEVFKDGCAEMQDILLDVTGGECSEAECHLVFFQLPEETQCDVLKWGWGDTDTRMEITAHLKNKAREDNE